LALLADLQRTVYPYKWLPISCRSGTDQWKFADHRPTFYHWATQPTTMSVHRQSRVECHTEQLDSVWNGITTVPAASIPLAVGILTRWTLVPNKTASVLAMLRSSLAHFLGSSERRLQRISKLTWNLHQHKVLRPCVYIESLIEVM